MFVYGSNFCALFMFAWSTLAVVHSLALPLSSTGSGDHLLYIKRDINSPATSLPEVSRRDIPPAVMAVIKKVGEFVKRDISPALTAAVGTSGEILKRDIGQPLQTDTDRLGNVAKRDIFNPIVEEAAT